MNTKNLQDPNAVLIDDEFEIDNENVVDDDPFADEAAFGDDDEDENIDTDDLTTNPDDDGEDDDDGLGDDENLDEVDDLDGEETGNDTMIALSDGVEVPLEDIEAAYTQRNEVAALQDEIKVDREQVNTYATQLKARNSQLETQVNNLANFLQTVIPPEPDRRLIQTDPSEFMLQEQHRKDVLAELQTVMAIRNTVNEQSQASSADEQAREAAAEKALLIKALPNLRDEKRLEAFNAETLKTAKDLGFTDEETAYIPDHRMRLALHYAAIGKKAMHNRANAKRRVAKSKASRPNPTRRANSGIATNIDKARQAYRKNGNAVAAEAIALAAFSED